MNEKWRVGIVMLFAVLAASAGEALTSKGMKATAQPLADQGALAQIRAAAGSGHVWVGIAFMIGYVFLYAYTLGLTDLSFALPLSASSYVLGVLFSKFYLREDVTPARLIGTGIIIVGVLVVAIWGQSSGGDKKDGAKTGIDSPDEPAPAHS